MFKKIILTVMLSLILQSFLALESANSQTVDIPFDYFYGRWANGHFSDLKYIIDEDSEFSGSGEYAFYSKKHAFKIVHLQEFIIIDNKSNLIVTPFFSYFYRPKTNWQINLQNIAFHRRYTSSDNHLPDIFRPKDDHIIGTITSQLLSDPNIKIEAKHAPYFYSVDKITSKNQYLLENSISLDYQNEYDLFWRSGHPASRDTDKDILWVTNNNFIYGITNDLHIKFDLSATSLKSISKNFDEYQTFDSIPRVSVREYESENKFFDFELTFTDIRMLPFYYNLSFGQDNSISNKYKNTEDDYINDVYDNSSEYARSYDYHNESNKFGIIIGFLSDDNFNKNIILDDYNNFYHKMLFHKQRHISLKFNHEKEESRYDNKSQQNAFSFTSSVGLFNKFEISFIADYTYRKYDEQKHFSFLPTSSPESENHNKEPNTSNSLSGFDSTVTFYYEKINAGLKLKYRSYEYSENLTQGWNQESNYDIAFGPILKAKDCYLELHYIPLHYDIKTHQEEINFFDFTELSDQLGGYLEANLTLGLGKQYNLSAEYFTTLFNKDPYRNYLVWGFDGPIYSYTTLSENKKFKISIRKRVKDKFDISVEYQYNEIIKEEKFISTLKVLL